MENNAKERVAFESLTKEQTIEALGTNLTTG